MTANFLKLEDSKTKLVLIDHPLFLAKIRDFELAVGSNKVMPSPCAQNLLVNFDSSLSCKQSVQETSSTVTFHICSLAIKKDHLPRDLLRRLCASLVISRLDYYNAVLTEPPKCSLCSLWISFAMAACLVYKARRSRHFSTF